MNIFHVNDDLDLMDIVEEVLPNANIRRFDDVMDAILSDAPVDLLLIDISAIAPIMFGSAGCYSQIARWAMKHPHVPIIIMTGVSSNFVEDVVDRVKEVLGEGESLIVKHLRLGGHLSEDLPKVMEELGFTGFGALPR